MMNGPEKSPFTRLKPLRLLGFVVILVGFGWFLWKHQPVTLSVSQDHKSKPVEQVFLGPRNSLAVLSFLPGEGGDTPAYLGKGVARELVDFFALEPGLQLIAATSSLFLAGGGENLDQAAQRLQAANLLYGTVTLREGSFQLDASLWSARLKRISWSGSFNGKLDQADWILNEVYRAVVDELPLRRHSSGPSRPLAANNAWLEYLQGRELMLAGLPGDARNHLRRAIEIEPGYSAARLALARIELAGSPPGRKEALTAVDLILRQDSENAHALGLRSYIERNLDWNWSDAVESASRAVALLPGDAALHNLAGQALFSNGRHREAEEHFREAVTRDPLNLNHRLGLGLAQEFIGEYDEALKTYRILLGLKPDFPGAHACRARIKLLQDNPDSALRESEQESDVFWKRYSRVLALSGQGLIQEADSQWKKLKSEYSELAAFQFAEIAAYMGRNDEAFEWLEAARLQKDGGMRELLGNRFLAGLHGDPRWLEMLTELGFPLDADRLSD